MKIKIYSFLLKSIVEFIIVSGGVYLGYFLNNKRLMQEQKANQKTELKIYKDKLIFNRLIEFRNHLQEYNENVSALYLSATDYLIEEPDYEKKKNIKPKIDSEMRKISEYERILNNDLIFLFSSEQELGEKYDEVNLAYQRLSATIEAHIFSSSESNSSKINYEYMRLFVPQNPETLYKSDQEIYEGLSEEGKRLVQESNSELKNNPGELISTFFAEHFEAIYNLMDKVSETLEIQFENLGK